MRYWRRFLPGALIVAVPGMLLLSRLGPVIRHATLLPIPIITVALVIVVLMAAAVFSRRLPAAEHFDLAAMAVALCGAAILTGHVWTPGLRSSQPRVASNGRNLVLVFLDTVRYDDVGELTSLRELEPDAISFESAWSTASWTVPSHFAMLNGQNPWLVASDPVSGRYAWPGMSLAEVLSSRGYVTGAIFANPLLRRGSGIPRGFQYLKNSGSSCAFCFSGLMYVVTRVYVHAGWRNPVCGLLSASQVTDKAIKFVNHSPRPYFLALNYIDAHAPYMVEPECRGAGSRAQISTAEMLELEAAIAGYSPLKRTTAESVHNQYLAALKCVDRSLTTLFRSLQRQPDYRKTVIVIVADHGEQFGEHSLAGHSNSVYEQLLHVPLIVRLPGEKPGRISEPVSTADLYATLLRAVGFAAGTRGLLSADRRPAVSMSQTRVGAKDSKVQSVFSIAGQQYHVMSWEDGREAVYDYRRDPRERKVLFMNDFDRNTVDQLRNLTTREWRMHVKGKAELKSLGYLQ
jgi:arylsulfatase A-like enzyme